MMADLWRLLADSRRKLTSLVVGDDAYGEPLLDRAMLEIRGALVVSPRDRVFVPPVVELEMCADDVRLLREAVGADDPTAYVRHRLGEAIPGAVFDGDFQVCLLAAAHVLPGRPRCVRRKWKVETAPYLASTSEAGRRLPLRPVTVVTREWLSAIVPADIEISDYRHAVLTVVSRSRVEIQPVANRYTALDGTRVTERLTVVDRHVDYRLTFGARQVLLRWDEQFRAPAGGQP